MNCSISLSVVDLVIVEDVTGGACIFVSCYGRSVIEKLILSHSGYDFHVLISITADLLILLNINMVATFDVCGKRSSQYNIINRTTHNGGKLLLHALDLEFDAIHASSKNLNNTFP